MNETRVATPNYNILAILSVATFLMGGTITIGGITINTPIQDIIRDAIIEEDYVLNRYNSLESYHAITAVLTVLSEDGKEKQAQLSGVSGKALRFFGWNDDKKGRESVIDSSMTDLLNRLKGYMNPNDYKAFEQDQLRVIGQYFRHEPAIARVPVVFNNEHPHTQFKNGAFIPVIVTLGEDKAGSEGGSRRLIQIAYFDLEEIAPVVDYYKARHPE